MMSAAVAIIVDLDGNPIAKLGSGNLVEFPVAPGTRFLNITANMGARTSLLEKFKAEPGQTYYWIVEPNMSANGFSIRRLSAEHGRGEAQRGYSEIEVR